MIEQNEIPSAPAVPAPVVTVDTPEFREVFKKLTKLELNTQFGEDSALIIHINAWHIDETAQAVAQALQGTVERQAYDAMTADRDAYRERAEKAEQALASAPGAAMPTDEQVAQATVGKVHPGDFPISSKNRDVDFLRYDGALVRAWIAAHSQKQCAEPAKRPMPPRDQALCNDGSEPDWSAYASAEAQGDGELPPLPACDLISYEPHGTPDCYSANRMREYGRLCLANRQPARVAPWSFCPECGSEEIRHEEGEHKQCAACHQEWFSSIDYTDVVRKHLGEWKAAPVALPIEQDRADFEDWYTGHARDIKANPIGSYECALMWAAWVARSGGCYKARGGWQVSPQPWGIDGAIAAPVAAAVAQGGIWVGTISSGDIEGDEIDWDAEFDRKVVDALPQLRVQNQRFGLFMAPLDGVKYADLAAYSQVDVDEASQPPADAAPEPCTTPDACNAQGCRNPLGRCEEAVQGDALSQEATVTHPWGRGEYAAHASGYQQGRAAGIAEAANYLKKLAEDYIQEYGSTEHETGFVNFRFGDSGRDYYHGLIEQEEAIRDLNKTGAA